jgi:hypothetical protein
VNGITFFMTIGMAGAAFLLGVMTCSLRIADSVRGVSIGILSMLAMGTVAAISVARGPLPGPLWLHYLLFALVPFLLGFATLAVLLRSASKSSD